jgi:hypothetical protein
MVVDLPAHVPRTPSGEINVEQLRREYKWEHPITSPLAGAPATGYGTGYRHLRDANFPDYLNAVKEQNS